MIPIQIFKVKPKEPSKKRKTWLITDVSLSPIPLPEDACIESGVECSFVALNNKEGIKAFICEEDARYSHKLQAKAEKAKVGPAVLSDVFPIFMTADSDESSRRDRSLKYKFAYITQLAIMKTYTRRQKEALCRKLVRVDISTNDMHSGNLGFIGNRLVRIDFGRVST